MPESDIFEVGSPLDIYGTESAKWLDEGCYLAVIKRKEMMQFNSLFMIKVAESKGLFGDPTKQRQESSKEEQRVVSPVRQGSLNSRRKGFKRPKVRFYDGEVCNLGMHRNSFFSVPKLIIRMQNRFSRAKKLIGSKILDDFENSTKSSRNIFS